MIASCKDFEPAGCIDGRGTGAKFGKYQAVKKYLGSECSGTSREEGISLALGLRVWSFKECRREGAIG